MKGFQKFFGQFQFVLISLLTTGLIVWLAASLQLAPDSSSLSQDPPASPLPSSPPPALSPGPKPDNSRTDPLYNDLPRLPQSPAQTAKKPATVPSAASSAQTYFGHLPYAEDESSRLTSVGEFVRDTYRREEYLDQEAAAALQKLFAAAAQSDLILQPISGFRTVKDQTELFEKQVQKYGSIEAAAELSAPPGYSEHHTGYAIDIGDRNQPDFDLKLAFADTSAYRWLTANVTQYGFELSFPPNNAQGVSFEPWHWRYVGTQRAAVQFATARNLSS